MRNLSRILLVYVLVALLIPTLITDYLMVRSQKAIYTDLVVHQKNHSLNLLATTLSSPVWNYRIDQVTTIAESMFEQSDVVAISVYDEVSGSIIYENEKNEKRGKITKTGKASIISHNKQVGTVTIAVSSHSSDMELARQEQIFLYLFVTQFVVSFISIWFLVYWHVLKSLLALIRKSVLLDVNKKGGKKKKFRFSLEGAYLRIEHTLGEFQKYHAIVNKHVISAKLDSKGIFVHTSDALTSLLRYEHATLRQHTFAYLFHKDVEPELLSRILMKAMTQGEAQEVMKVVGADGSIFWFKCTFADDDKDAGKQSYTVVCEDISDEKKIEKLSVTDNLTTLYNRRKCDAIIAQQIELFRRYGTIFSVIMLDIDHFKQINDTFGHHAGDRVLQNIAGVLQKNTRTTDVVCRWGGEEFVIICPSMKNQGAFSLAENLKELISAAKHKTVGHVTASFGVSDVGQSDTTVEEIVKRADEALYSAKASGRNKVCNHSVMPISVL